MIMKNIIYLIVVLSSMFMIGCHKDNENEVDFVCETGEELIYIQVSLSVRDENTLRRELKPLESIQDHYKKYLITLDYDTNNYNGIKQISAMDFLLEREDI